MAGKISEMTLAASINLTDRFELTQDPAGTPATKSGSLAQVAGLIGADVALWAPGDFVTRTGSPARSGVTVGGVDAWYFDQSSQEAITGTFLLPPHWSTFDIKFATINPTVASGVVRMDIAANSFGTDGAAYNGTSVIVSATNISAPAANTVKVTTMATGVANGPLPLRVGISRVADAAGDTLAADYGLLYCLAERAS